MDVKAPRMKDITVKSPRVKSQPVPHDTRKKITIEKKPTKMKQTVYSARRNDSAPS